MNILFTEAGIQRCSVKNVLLEISQNSQENICAIVSFLIKLQALGLRPAAALLKKRLWHRCFPVNFAKFIRAPFLKDHLSWLLLSVFNLNSTIYFIKFKHPQKIRLIFQK